ncbi:MAG TPA: VOC family protein [Pyrinomonadaceae bacterium]|jgi:uncharacterized glyoxalase superfamily protein PhnB
MNTFKVFAAVLSITAAIGVSNTQGQNTKENRKMINRSTPILHVRSVEPAVKFWTEKFGFKVTIEVPEGDHVGFAALENGNVELMYQTYSGMKADPKNPLAGAVEKGPSFIFMEVADINKVIEELKGGEIVQGLHETFYGSKEIVAKEPGGHFVIFSQLPVK